MLRRRLPSFFAVLALLAGGPAGAQVAQSDFAADADGWRNVTLPYPSAVPPTILHVYTPVWNPGGFLTLQDPDGSGSTGDSQYWQAPAAFLGAKIAAYGSSLAFDIGDAGSGFGGYHQEDVILVGGGLTLVYDLGAGPGATRTTFVVPLSEGGWRRDGPLGAFATATEVRSVLSSLDAVFIRAEFQLGPDNQSIDNVVMGQGVAGAPGPRAAAAIELAPPAPNPSSGPARLAFRSAQGGASTLDVFDLAGRIVFTRDLGTLEAGAHAATWDGRGTGGEPVAPGLYRARIRVGGASVSRTLLRWR